MKKYLLVFAASTPLCILLSFVFWIFGANSKDIRYLGDGLFMAGASFFVIGMIITLFTTSRWHYYRHIRDKMKGKIKDDAPFEKDEKKRGEQMRFGIVITVSGVIAFVLSGYLSIKYGLFE